MIETYPDAGALADAAADAVSAAPGRGLAAHGRASLVATGGRSPGPVYDRLRTAPTRLGAGDRHPVRRALRRRRRSGDPTPGWCASACCTGDAGRAHLPAAVAGRRMPAPWPR